MELSSLYTRLCYSVSDVAVDPGQRITGQDTEDRLLRWPALGPQTVLKTVACHGRHRHMAEINNEV